MLGTTFAPRQITYLGLDPHQAFQDLLKQQPEIIRLGVYWQEAEPTPNHYDFSQTEWYLKQCERTHQPVMLTIGVKAPRWPEYFWPDHIQVKDPQNSHTQQRLLRFVAQSTTHFQHFNCITHWQVENEPLDVSGPNKLSLPPQLLAQEVAIVRQLDPQHRRVILNLWANKIDFRQVVQLVNVADILGLDIYPKQFIGRVGKKKLYRGPDWQDLRQICQRYPTWITELQAEPWEPDLTNYQSPHPASINGDLLKQNLEQAQTLGAQKILFWGWEYWWWRRQQPDLYFS